MKKLFFIFVAAFTMMATSCSNEQEPAMPKEDNAPVVKGKVRSADEAIAIAMAAKKHYSSTKSRALFTVKNVKCYGAPSTRSGLGADSLYYIVNFDDEQGYAIIGADRRIDDILAVVENGNFDPDGIAPDSPRQFMIDIVNSYAETQDWTLNPIEPIDTLKVSRQYLEEYFDTIDVRNELMLTTRWFQEKPFANYAASLYDPKFNIAPSRMQCGCVPLAIAEIMSYFEYPKTMSILFDDINMRLTPDWKALKEFETGNKKPIQIDDDSYERTADQIALIVRQAAKYAKSTGEKDGSVGTKESDIPGALNSFGYNCISASKKRLYDNLVIPTPSIQDGVMILCNGKIPSKTIDPVTLEVVGEDFNHAFILDGVDMTYYEKGFRVWDTGYTPWKFIESQYVERILKLYVHVNWGWGGTDNGYYNGKMFLSVSDRKLDSGCDGTYNPDDFARFSFYEVKRK